METIRRSVFETNSSSTHCLSIQKTSMKLPVHKELFLKPYRFEPFHGSDAVATATHGEMGTFVDRVRFMCNIILQNVDGDAAGRFLAQLKGIFPNSTFDVDANRGEGGGCPYEYVFEDIESFTSASHWNSTDFPLQKVLGNDDLLMHIIEYGRVIFASRDYPESQGLYNEIWKLPTKNDCISIVAGD